MDKCQYDELKKQQNVHWWFTGKREIVIDFAKTYLRLEENENNAILDIGCGMGLMLDALQNYGNVYGLDIEDDAVEYCNQILAERNMPSNVYLGSLPNNIPFEDKMFDYIFALDVIEHVENDKEAIAKMRSMLKDGGKLLITVPAHMHLWSYNDELNHHYRRYEKEELTTKIEESGLHIIKVSFYNSYLYPFAWVVRKTKNVLKIQSSDVADETKNGVVNRLFKKIFVSEKYRLRKKDFKNGVSIIAACCK